MLRIAARALALAIAFSFPLFAQTESAETRLATAKAILRRVPLIDGHNDLPMYVREHLKGRLSELDLRRDLSEMRPVIHTDLVRLREGGLGAQIWSVYVPASLAEPVAVQQTIEQIDLVHRLVATYPDTFELALTAADVRRIHGTGKVASLIGIEGGHSIGSSLAVLRQMYALGARSMTLTHSGTLPWADASTDDPKHGGLTPFGEEVVREMNRIGMLVDLSHVSPATMHDALDVTKVPVIFSHSSARALTDVARNVPDDVLRRLPQNGGVVMVTFVPPFVSEASARRYAELDAATARFKSLYEGDPARVAREMKAWQLANPAPRATLGDVADHIDHIREIAGIDHIGIGSDFDGISSTPVGLEDVSTYPALFAELLRRGYSEGDLEKVAGLNVLRVMEKAEAYAVSQRAIPPSERLIAGMNRASTPDVQFVEGPQGRLRVVSRGAGGTPVVFLHGNGSNRHVEAEVMAAVRATPKEAFAGAMRGIAGQNGALWLARYPGPLFAIAAKDLATQPFAMHNATKRIEVVTLDDVSHWLMMDRPEEFNVALDEFLARVTE